jgi:hypothetical protein
MPITVERDEVSRALGHISNSLKGGRINKEGICWRRVITDHAARKAKAA